MRIPSESFSKVLCAFVAEQLGVDVECFGDYAERDQTRPVQHLAELEPLRRYATLTALVLEHHGRRPTMVAV